MYFIEVYLTYNIALVSGVEQVIKLFFVVGPEPGSALITIYEVFHDPPGASKHFILCPLAQMLWWGLSVHLWFDKTNKELYFYLSLNSSYSTNIC